MKNLLRKLLGIQTYKIILVNPTAIRFEDIRQMMEVNSFHAWIIHCRSINDIKIVDTGIVVQEVITVNFPTKSGPIL